MRFALLPRGTSERTARRSLVEGLEDRRLLSAGVALTAAAADQSPPSVPLAPAYSGVVKYKKQVGQSATGAQAIVVTVASVSPAGVVNGTLTSPTLGSVPFAGQLNGRTFTASFDGVVDGTLSGKVSGSGKKVQATLLNVTEGKKAKMTVKALGASGRTLTPAALAGTTTTGNTTTGTTTGTGSSNVTVHTQSGVLYDAEGELHFVDTYVGSTTLQITPETHGNDPQPATTTGNYSVTLNITSENSDDLLTGTMSAGALGSYNVIGVVKGKEMTLIVTPSTTATNAGGTGVLHLRISADARSYTGRFQQEDEGVLGFGPITLTRPNAFNVNASGVAGNGGTGSNGGTGNTGTNSGTGTGSTTGSTTGVIPTTGVNQQVGPSTIAKDYLRRFFASQDQNSVQVPNTNTDGTGTTGTNGTNGTGTIGGTISGGTVGSGVLIPGTGAVGTGVGSVGTVGTGTNGTVGTIGTGTNGTVGTGLNGTGGTIGTVGTGTNGTVGTGTVGTGTPIGTATIRDTSGVTGTTGTVTTTTTTTTNGNPVTTPPTTIVLGDTN